MIQTEKPVILEKNSPKIKKKKHTPQNNYIGSRTYSTFFSRQHFLVFCRETFPGCIPILKGGNPHPLRSPPPWNLPPRRRVVLLQACGDEGCHMTDVAFPDVLRKSSRLRKKMGCSQGDEGFLGGILAYRGNKNWYIIVFLEKGKAKKTKGILFENSTVWFEVYFFGRAMVIAAQIVR